MAPYSRTSGDAVGSIMPVIMTVHIVQSSKRCGTSQFAVIIQALAPVMGPYMSRAITTIHSQQTRGSRTRRTTAAARSYCNADSTMVGERSAGVADPGIEGSTTDSRLWRPSRPVRPATRYALRASPGKRRVLSVVFAADVFPCQTERMDAAVGCTRQRKAICGRMAGVIQVQGLGGIRVDPLCAF